MRTKLILLICLLASLLMLTGCDFLRTVAGRPTSADLQAKLESINRTASERAAAANKAVAAAQDTLKHNTDSADSAGEIREQAPAAQEQTADTAQQVSSRPPYYVIVGTFSVSENAENYSRELQEKGYNAKAFPSRGMVAVGVYPDDPSVPSDVFLSKVLADPSFPRDSWAYYPGH